MAIVHVDLALDEDVAQMLHQSAARNNVPPDRYISELIEKEARLDQDELAEEGYRYLSGLTGDFADAAWSTANGTWPRWDEFNHDTKP